MTLIIMVVDLGDCFKDFQHESLMTLNYIQGNELKLHNYSSSFASDFNRIN